MKEQFMGRINGIFKNTSANGKTWYKLLIGSSDWTEEQDEWTNIQLSIFDNKACEQAFNNVKDFKKGMTIVINKYSENTIFKTRKVIALIANDVVKYEPSEEDVKEDVEVKEEVITEDVQSKQNELELSAVKDEVEDEDFMKAVFNEVENKETKQYTESEWGSDKITDFSL